jgi:hypothetical protein
MGRQGRAADLATRETESRRKTGRLCGSKDCGFSQVFADKAQKASQGETLNGWLDCVASVSSHDLTLEALPLHLFPPAQSPGYEHVGQALRFCLSDLIKIKAYRREGFDWSS